MPDRNEPGRQEEQRTEAAILPDFRQKEKVIIDGRPLDMHFPAPAADVLAALAAQAEERFLQPPQEVSWSVSAHVFKTFAQTVNSGAVLSVAQADYAARLIDSIGFASFPEHLREGDIDAWTRTVKNMDESHIDTWQLRAVQAAVGVLTFLNTCSG